MRTFCSLRRRATCNYENARCVVRTVVACCPELPGLHRFIPEESFRVLPKKKSGGFYAHQTKIVDRRKSIRAIYLCKHFCDFSSLLPQIEKLTPPKRRFWKGLQKVKYESQSKRCKDGLTKHTKQPTCEMRDACQRSSLQTDRKRRMRWRWLVVCVDAIIL